LTLEALGIPTVAIATEEFRTAARAQAAALGRADFDPVYVRHPIQDQTPDEIAARADAALEEIVRRLTFQGW
jgi:alkanesulfonate monooxygenase SsuD/methylene tetrahydromethanopterin reductase-like flavin-dependent oxidoreductase (luciferase family)